jgi:hypothetical protein
MRLIAVAALLLAFNAFAVEFTTTTFSHTDTGIDGFSRNYYSCDFAESALESHLETLGASNISVSCSGGIEYNWGMFPVNLAARFDMPSATPENHTRSENIRVSSRSFGNSSCNFHTKLLNKLLPLFTNVAVNAKRTSCMDNDSRWSYDLTVFQ